MPVTLAQAKKQCQIETDFTDDDAHITELIEDAIAIIEQNTKSDVLDTTNVLEYEISAEGIQTLYRIMQSPLQSFTKLEAYANNAYTDVPAASYKVTEGFNNFEVEITGSVSATKLRFTFKTGYETAAKTPKPIKRAALVKVADLFYPERTSYTPGQPMKNTLYNDLIAPHIRRFW